MSTKHLLDPELHAIVEQMPAIKFSAEMLPKFRAARNKEVVLGKPSDYKVKREEIFISRAQGRFCSGASVRALLYVPENPCGAAYLHIHGGGYIIGLPEQSDPPNLTLASKLGLTILSVSYRLGPEHPIPAPIEDCYTGLAWLHEQAAELGIDRTRIAIGGESAGGGLAAALAIYARDLGEYEICHQHLTYPMLDNQTGTTDHLGDPWVGEFVWTRESNQFGWQAYLGEQPAIAPQVPARVADFSGLPPAWIYTVGLDLFRDENIRYAQGLMAAGIAVELTVYPGACHGFQMVPNTKAGASYARSHRAALARALQIDI